MKFIIEGALLVGVILVITFQINTHNNLKAELEECQSELETAMVTATATFYDTIWVDTVWRTAKMDTIDSISTWNNSNYWSVHVAGSDTVLSDWHYGIDSLDGLYWNYKTNQLTYINRGLTDKDAAILLPQHKISLDTYKWYRKNKRYSVKKSIRLTEKYWTLNLPK